MDKKTYDYMKQRTDAFKKINDKIIIIDKRIEFYNNKNITKSFGQTNHYIGINNLGGEFVDKLVELTLEALEEEKSNLQIQLEEI